MFKRHCVQASQPDTRLRGLEERYRKLQDENALLVHALFMLGFDVQAVIARLSPEGDKIWRELPFLLANVDFDVKKAKRFGLSERGVRYGLEAFNSVVSADAMKAKAQLGVTEPRPSVRDLWR